MRHEKPPCSAVIECDVGHSPRRIRRMRATLFGVPASHPTLAAELMLRHKRVDYGRVDLVSAAHRTLLRALGFPRKTVPAMRLEGAKVQGSSEIARALDALVASPPLFPADPERRREVE